MITTELKTGGKEIDTQTKEMKAMNQRLSHLDRRAENIHNQMESYLERTSSCKLYVLIAVELFFFIIIMSL